jgi:hypothetical protein
VGIVGKGRRQKRGVGGQEGASEASSLLVIINII